MLIDVKVNLKDLRRIITRTELYRQPSSEVLSSSHVVSELIEQEEDTCIDPEILQADNRVEAKKELFVVKRYALDALLCPYQTNIGSSEEKGDVLERLVLVR